MSQIRVADVASGSTYMSVLTTPSIISTALLSREDSDELLITIPYPELKLRVPGSS